MNQIEQIAQLLLQTGKAHHTAFIEVDAGSVVEGNVGFLLPAGLMGVELNNRSDDGALLYKALGNYFSLDIEVSEKKTGKRRREHLVTVGQDPRT